MIVESLTNSKYTTASSPLVIVLGALDAAAVAARVGMPPPSIKLRYSGQSQPGPGSV